MQIQNTNSAMRNGLNFEDATPSFKVKIEIVRYKLQMSGFSLYEPLSVVSETWSSIDFFVLSYHVTGKKKKHAKNTSSTCTVEKMFFVIFENYL